MTDPFNAVSSNGRPPPDPPNNAIVRETNTATMAESPQQNAAETIVFDAPIAPAAEMVLNNTFISMRVSVPPMILGFHSFEC